ncbi:MAG: hypothetical protein ACO3UU_09425 [Minisyncoccia bacterium]
MNIKIEGYSIITLMDTPAFIFDILNNEIYTIHKDMLHKISKKYNIDINELTSEFLKPLTVTPEEIEKVVIYKKHQRRSIPDTLNRCKACIWNKGKGGQCTRSCIQSQSFCAQHIDKQKNGTVFNKITCKE